MKAKPLLPVDIALPENEPLEGGALFVRLPTREALEQFWAAHRETLPYAARGVAYGDYQIYLREDEWVFAPTKAVLVRTFTRWDQVGITCSWYDWATQEPDDHAAFFRDLTEADLKGRTPENYRGYWVLGNLPDGCADIDWFGSFFDREIIDASLPLTEVVEQLQQWTFDAWQGAMGDLAVMDRAGVDQHLAFWREHDIEEAKAGAYAPGRDSH